jgi:hypothetical protein
MSRPRCADCGAVAKLTRVERGELQTDLCPSCAHKRAGQPRASDDPYTRLGPMNIDPGLRQRLDLRLRREPVSLRAFVERALTHELERTTV